MERKRIYIIIVITILLVVSGLGVWRIIKYKNARLERESIQQGIVLSSEGANWTPEQNKNLQRGLINSIGKYLEAVSYTNAVFQADVENTTYVEWKGRVNKTIQLWEELEQIENNMTVLLEELEVPELSQSILKQDVVLSNTKYNFTSIVQAAEGSGIPELGAITAVFDSANHGAKIRRIMEVFGWDRETAFYHLKREQGLMESEAWDQAGDTYARWETAMRAIKDTSKVTVFVGANIISAGSASAVVGTFQTIAVAVGGVSLAIEVGEDVNIAIGNEENAAVLRQTQEAIKPVVEIVCIASLKDLGDPGNLFYMADKAGQFGNLIKEGYAYFVKDEAGKVIISKEPLEDLRITEPDLGRSKTAGLPEGKYKINGENMDVKKDPKDSTIEEEKEGEIQNINAIDNIIETFTDLEVLQEPTVQSSSTKIQTSQVNTLTINIPEEFVGPFNIEYIDMGGSGAGVVLPSTVNSRNFTGEFISSKPGTFVVKIRIIDAEGNIYIAKTTIFVEGEELVEEENSINEQEEKGLSFECIIPAKYPSTQEGCHVNVVCPNSENPCSGADSIFINKIKTITAGYRDLDPYRCSEIFSIEACKTINPEICQQAWEGETSEDGFSKAEKEACAQVDRDLCEIEKKKLGGLYERCVDFLGYPDGAFAKIQPAREELLDCYNQVRAKKNKACTENFGIVREQEKSQILQEVEVLREEQEKIMAEERVAWDQISQLKDQIHKLNPRQDIDEIAALEAQIAELREEGVRLDNKHKASEADISVLYGKRDKLMSDSNNCYNYCVQSIDDPQSKALGKFAGKLNQLSDYKFLIEITE